MNGATRSTTARGTWLRPRRAARSLAAAAITLHAGLAGAAGAFADERPEGEPAVAATGRKAAAVNLPQLLQALRTAPPAGAESEALAQAAKGLKLASDLDLKQASKAMNEALQLDARNSYLHFFNGFIYHLQARQGDTDKTDLAIEGYQQAARLDPGNWIAIEFLGLALLEQKQYGRAQAAFAEVLLQRPDDVVVLSRMLSASYMAGDAATACTMADRLAAQPDVASDNFFRTAAAVYASCGAFDKAEALRKAYARGGNAGDADRTGRRIAQWRQFHDAKGREAAAAGPMVKTQFMPSQAATPPGGFAPGGGFNTGVQNGGFNTGVPGGGYNPGVQNGGYNAGAQPGSGPNGAGGYGQQGNGGSRMVLVDVVMVRTEDTISTSKGVNLLSALQLQLGTNGQPAYSRGVSITSGTAGDTSSTILTRALSIPALAYSLNLANANSNLNEVLARPTLAAVEGMRSEFFSGTSLNAAVVSTGGGVGGSSVSLEKRYGVKLTVIPEILPNGMIKLAIDASRTFLKPPSANIGFTYKLEISEILANANVVLRMGDTLVLGGLSEKESTKSRDGVPGLQDVPLLQYAFSQQARTEYQRSVLILITPRPAAYTWLSDESRAAAAAAGDDSATQSLDVLRARYGDWFKTYPNLASVFHHLNSADLYREFRTGDVTLERWDRMETTRERLLQALEFLYY